METLALVDWLIEDCGVTSVTLSGLSLGGALCSVAGLFCRHDVAIVSSVGCDTPYAIYAEVILNDISFFFFNYLFFLFTFVKSSLSFSYQGLLRRSVDFKGLGGDKHLDILKKYSLSEIRDRSKVSESNKFVSLLYGKVRKGEGERGV